MTFEQKRAALERAGFTCGPRDSRLNRNHPGLFMVVEAHSEDELPTDDGSTGPWCIVGDDLHELVQVAYYTFADNLQSL